MVVPQFLTRFFFVYFFFLLKFRGSNKYLLSTSLALIRCNLVGFIIYERIDLSSSAWGARVTDQGYCSIDLVGIEVQTQTGITFSMKEDFNKFLREKRTHKYMGVVVCHHSHVHEESAMCDSKHFLCKNANTTMYFHLNNSSVHVFIALNVWI